MAVNMLRDEAGVTGDGVSKRALRVLFAITTSNLGGAESQLEWLVSNLDPTRFSARVCSLCPPGEIGRRIASFGTPVSTLEMSPKPRLGEMIAALGRLARLIDETQTDIVHSMLYRANVLMAVAARFSRRRPPVIASQHSLTPKDRPFAVMAARFSRSLVARTVAVSEAVKEALVTDHRVAPERITVIDNGVDLRRFRPSDPAPARDPLGLGGDSTVVGTVGRLSPEKGLEHLLEAFALARGGGACLELVVAGDGPQRTRLEERARHLNLAGHVRFLGIRRDAENLYPAFDVFALPSLEEGSPIALLEAMACGCAVLATRVGGVPEMVDDGRTGLLIPPGSPAALAKALVTLADQPSLRRRLGQSARREVARRFDLSAMVSRYEDLYRACLEPDSTLCRPRSPDVP